MLLSPFLAAADVKSWSIFCDEMRLLKFGNEEFPLENYSQSNLGSKDGFEPSAQTVELALFAPLETIGIVVDEAFNRCD